MPLEKANWRYGVFYRAREKAGIRRCRLHDPTHLRVNSFDDRRVPRVREGPTRAQFIKMTVDVYGHFIPGANRQAVNNLPSLTPLQPVATDSQKGKRAAANGPNLLIYF